MRARGGPPVNVPQPAQTFYLPTALKIVSMWLLPFFSIAVAFIWLAATLQDQGVRWASKVCLSSWGLCGYSDWLLAAAGIALAAFVFSRKTV